MNCIYFSFPSAARVYLEKKIERFIDGSPVLMKVSILGVSRRKKISFLKFNTRFVSQGTSLRLKVYINNAFVPEMMSKYD